MGDKSFEGSFWGFGNKSWSVSLVWEQLNSTSLVEYLFGTQVALKAGVILRLALQHHLSQQVKKILKFQTLLFIFLTGLYHCISHGSNLPPPHTSFHPFYSSITPNLSVLSPLLSSTFYHHPSAPTLRLPALSLQPPTSQHPTLQPFLFQLPTASLLAVNPSFNHWRVTLQPVICFCFILFNRIWNPSHLLLFLEIATTMMTWTGWIETLLHLPVSKTPLLSRTSLNVVSLEKNVQLK